MRTTRAPSHEQNYVVNELIIAFVRKNVLSDLEGKALLQKAALMPTADNMEYDARTEWTYPEEVENGRSDNVDQ